MIQELSRHAYRGARSRRPALRALAVFLMLLGGPAAQASPLDAGERQLRGLKVLPDGNVLLQSDLRQPFMDPAGCNGYGPNNPWVVLETTHPGFLSLYSLAFSAIRSVDLPLRVYVEGCNNGVVGSPVGVPVVAALETGG